MPLLGRLFTKKTKASDHTETPALESPTAASDSNHSSRTVSSYVSPDPSIPSYPNAKSLVGFRSESGSTTSPSPGSSSSGINRLRFFGRKKSGPVGLDITGSASDVDSSKEYNALQRRADPHVSSVDTDLPESRRLRPPPSRSAIFAAYADPGSSLSTRSLPENAYQNLDSPHSHSSPPPMAALKRPSLLTWINSTLSLKSPDESSDSVADSSFNLKSFRHIRVPSPPIPDSPNGNSPSPTFTPPIARPRGSSVHSDTSQRISVAAFREAQARRSSNASPIPPPRDLGSMTMISPSTANGGPRTSRSLAALQQGGNRRQSGVITSTSEEEEDSSGDDSDNDSTYKGRRNSHNRPKAKSDLGHGSKTLRSQLTRNEIPPVPRVPQTHLGHSPLGPSSRPATYFDTRDNMNRPEVLPRSQSSLGVYNDSAKKGAIASATSYSSAIVHKPSASTASSSTTTGNDKSCELNLLNSDNFLARKFTLTQNRNASNKQPPKGRIATNPPPRDSDSDSDDDEPLSKLVPPKRPGSSMSTLSNPRSTSGHSNITSRSVSHSKPLIDVKQLIASKPTVVNSSPSDATFTQGTTLLSKMAPKKHVTSKSSSEDIRQPLTRKTDPMFIPPPSSPHRELKELSGDIPRKPNVEQKLESIPFISSTDPLRREASPELQKRDPISDRLTRVVKKSMTNPSSPVQSSSPLPSVTTSIVSVNISTVGATSPEQKRQSNNASRIALPRTPPPILRQSSDYSPPDEGLAQLLGTAGIKYISRNGESPDESSEGETSADEQCTDKGRIAPIPIKQRSPPPAFTVISRPPLPKPKQINDSLESKKQAESAEKEPSATQSYLSYPSSRQRSSSLIPSSSTSSFPSLKPSESGSNSTMSTYPTSVATDVSSKSGSSNGHTGSTPKADKTTDVQPPLGPRQRSTTMDAVVSSSQKPKPYNMPDRAFVVFRDYSPASSMGDSSGSRVPRTPRDGSDLGTHERKTLAQKKPDESAVQRRNAHVKRRSVSFEDNVEEFDTKPAGKSHVRDGARIESEVGGDGRGKNHAREGARARADDEVTVNEKEKEEKRRERRRKEAKNAIEVRFIVLLYFHKLISSSKLGNVIHGPPPVLDDDNDIPVNQAMNSSTTPFNSMMNMGNPMAMQLGFGSPSGGWHPNMNQPMLSPAQFMAPRPADPNLFVAHQRAMMFAKQAYQMAVGQQAMAAAAEEWERGSAMSGYGGGGNMYGGSSVPTMMTSPLGVMPGMGMMQGLQGGSVAGWSSSASVYGGMGDDPRFGSYLNPAMFSSAHSDYGGPTSSRNAATWTPSRSTYGGSFGPSTDTFGRRPAGQQQQPTWNGARDTMQFPSTPSVPTPLNATGRNSPDLRSPPRIRTVSQPASPSRIQIPRRAPPPSSWRNAGP